MKERPVPSPELLATIARLPVYEQIQVLWKSGFQALPQDYGKPTLATQDAIDRFRLDGEIGVEENAEGGLLTNP